MLDTKPNAHALATWLSSVIAMCGTLTLADLSVMVGILTTVLTLVMNLVYTYRKDRREQRESDAAVARLEKDRSH